MGHKLMFFLEALQMEDPIQLKEEGNKYFQASDYEKAVHSYTQALKLNKDKALQAVLYRNRAACFLKQVRKDPSWPGRARADEQGGSQGRSPAVGCVACPLQTALKWFVLGLSWSSKTASLLQS